MDRIGVVVFMFGEPGTLRSNEALSIITLQAAMDYNALVFAQKGIFAPPDITDIEFISGENGNPPSTLKIAMEATEWSWRKKIKKLIIVAATPHAPRCLRDLKRVIKDKNLSVIPEICSCAEHFSKRYWFSQKSKQLRTRSPLWWTIREAILMHIPFWLYKSITS